MKICKKCNDPKSESEFHIRSKSKDGLSYYCNSCVAASEKKSRNMVKHYQWIKNRRKFLSDFIDEYLSCHPCIDCGEKDIIVLEFDHVRGEKLGNVSEMVLRNHGIDKIKSEIEKCEIRCCNCHRRKTVQRRLQNPRIASNAYKA